MLEEMQIYIDNKDIELLYLDPAFLIALITSNGVEYVQINENGHLIFALDERYIEAVNLYNDLIHKYKFIEPNYSYINNIENEIRDMLNGNVFMTYSGTYLFTFRDTEKTYGVNGWPNNIGQICFPIGPGLKNGVTSRDWGRNLYYGIPISCKNPDVAVLYIQWLFSNQNFMNDRKLLLTNKLYGGSDTLFSISKEWEINAVNNSYYNWGQQIRELIEENDPVTLIKHKNNDFQKLLDDYLNVFTT